MFDWARSAEATVPVAASDDDDSELGPGPELISVPGSGLECSVIGGTVVVTVWLVESSIAGEVGERLTPLVTAAAYEPKPE